MARRFTHPRTLHLPGKKCQNIPLTAPFTLWEGNRSFISSSFSRHCPSWARRKGSLQKKVTTSSMALSCSRQERCHPGREAAPFFTTHKQGATRFQPTGGK